MGLFDVGGILGDRQHVEPEVAAFFGNHISHIHAFAGFFSTGLGLEDITGETGSDTDVAVGEVRDVLGGMEVSHVRTHRQQLLLSVGVVLGIGAVGVAAHVVEHRWNHLVS
ncbi:hypothetical protein D3C76_1511470 [compost metagenome]